MDNVELFPEVAKMPLFWANMVATEKIIINQGGTYSTKSQSLIRILFVYAISTPNLKIEVAGATLPKLRSDTMEIAEGISRHNSNVHRSIKKFHATLNMFTFHNGSRMIFKSYETAMDADGPKRDILYLSEARNFQWKTVEQLIKRTKRKIFIDYNPVELFFVHDKLINCPIGRNGQKEYPSVKVIRSWHIHNNFIDQAKHDEIENIQDKEMWKAYARGLTATLSGMCYPGWTQIESFPACEQVVWGIDFGYSVDPTCAVKVGIKPFIWVEGKKQYLPYDYVFHELCYAPGIASGQLAKILTENGYEFGQPVYIDHDKTMQRELRSLRIVAIMAIKGEGSVEARVLHLRVQRVAYTKTSENIANEKKRYMFHVDPTGRITNRPVKGNDHAMNGCEYGAFSHAVRTGLVKGFAEEEK